MIRESSQREILVSKIIFGILTPYVVYWIGINLLNHGKFAISHLINKKYFSGISLMLFCLVILIFQIIVLTQMLKNKISKYEFTNFKRNFHPFFKDENQKDLLSEYIFASSVITIILFIIPYILNYFGYDTGLDDDTTRLDGGLFAIYVHIGILMVSTKRNDTLDKLPVKLMETNKISLILPYEDYINKKINDDEPHLNLNQSFEFTVKKLPRNESEKNTIEISNNNTPNNSALIARIEDCGLASAIRNGDVIKSRLVSIGEFAKLEIEISIQKAS